MHSLRLLTTYGLLLALTAPVAVPTAAAHTGHTDAGETHAETDLANMPISKIERIAATNKKRIFKETGVEPGAARSEQIGDSAATMMAVDEDPGQSGSWSPVIDTQVVPVFVAMLPNSKVLIWDSVGDGVNDGGIPFNYTRAMVWNPADNTFRRVDVQGYNIFCAGFAHLPNGNILVAGGTANANNDGIVQTHIFNWQTETWSRGADMASERWYPSVTAMANGELSIVGGGPQAAEVYQSNGLLRILTNFTNPTYGQRTYPFMISRPDTQLGLFGPYSTMFTVNTAGDGAITATGTRDGERGYGSFATFDIGKTLVVGGGAHLEGEGTYRANETAVVLDYNSSLNPAVLATGSMSTGRRQLNATVLADGSVLATGGMSTGGYTVDLNHAVTSAERWDPATGQWTVLSSASRIRQYHSTATLLPDGRVMTGGGGVCGECNGFGYLEKNIEYFTPPYLYKKDGSGQLATRPAITYAPPTMGINTTYSIMANPGSKIRKVALVGLGDVTHSIDQGQRYIPLNFRYIPIKRVGYAGTRLDITGPPNSGVAPPGYYMLFVIDDAGVPSVAKVIQVTPGPKPLMSAVRNTGAARCVDVPNSTLTIRTYIQSYTCNNTKAQALTRFPNDQSLRVLGNCLDVPNANFVSGQRIWTYTCNNSNAQKWQFGTDGTIRPVAKTTLCLTAASTAQNAAINISTCSSTNTRQKWTW